MVDFLKRELAPLTEAAWARVDETVAQVLRAQLSGRRVVDFSGPHGWEYDAVDLGRLHVGQPGAQGVPWGLRAVLPVVELRLPFKLNVWELDNISRGAKDPDLRAAEDAAQRVVLFEETAIFRGFPEGQIGGILSKPEQVGVRLPEQVTGYPHAVAEALKLLHRAGVEGPYALVLGMDPYHLLLQSGWSGESTMAAIREAVGGPILASAALDGGVLLSRRGGDFELSVGQDLSIGYQSHDKESVELFLTESFTFRVLRSEAAVGLKGNSEL